ncbi:C-type LECtin [Caenorhabditis elegans]|uniref:C-type LECtin n=1 Tax=Caenorhabditis elegans TaxID=6239 RepID=Q20038_CAEEL|nr:C-type LECtin [Caenorhabditis elegans]CCD70536.1 C-type LECtin [Caenorhabditis elegans]|eukprot:NP_494815.1 C-type LECtin [Caenorhabditis elegans]
MLVLFLLFLVVPAVSAKDPRCPKNFTFVKRTLTFKNNFTKGWCLGIFNGTDVGNRDRARSVCLYHNASLSNPENSHELEIVSDVIRARNISLPIALDGQLSPRCKALIFRGEQSQQYFDQRTEEGDCNINNHLFVYDDINTDTLFIRSKLGTSAGTNGGYSSQEDGVKFRFTRDCNALTDAYYYFSNGTHFYAVDGRTELLGCFGEKDKQNKHEYSSVLCGRFPL